MAIDIKQISPGGVDMGGKTVKTTDFWGNEVEEHFGDAGELVGKTVITKDASGNTVREDVDIDSGAVIGRSNVSVDRAGDEIREEVDVDSGAVVSWSKVVTDNSGEEYIEKYDRDTGGLISRRSTGIHRDKIEANKSPSCPNDYNHAKAASYSANTRTVEKSDPNPRRQKKT